MSPSSPSSPSSPASLPDPSKPGSGSESESEPEMVFGDLPDLVQRLVHDTETDYRVLLSFGQRSPHLSGYVTRSGRIDDREEWQTVCAYRIEYPRHNGIPVCRDPAGGSLVIAGAVSHA